MKAVEACYIKEDYSGIWYLTSVISTLYVNDLMIYDVTLVRSDEKTFYYPIYHTFVFREMPPSLKSFTLMQKVDIIELLKWPHE